MSFRRRSRDSRWMKDSKKRQTRKKSAAVGMERLEERRLFAILDTALTPPNQPTTLEFLDGSDNIVRITLLGDTRVELVWGFVDHENFNNTSLLLNAPSPAGEDGTGADLYYIHVTRAGADSAVIVAQVPDLDDEERPMQPFDGSVTLRVPPLTGGQTIEIETDDSGSIILGTRTEDVDDLEDEDNFTILEMDANGVPFVDIPAPAGGILRPGLTVATGQNLEKFMFGGTVTGVVNIGGSIDVFYAGWIMTGNSNGFTPALNTDNFIVQGELRNLITIGTIGGATDGGEALFTANTVIDVAGRVGQIRSAGGVFASVNVLNDPSLIAGFGGPQQEIEFTIFPEGNSSDFEAGFLFDGNAFFRNESFDTPQFLGTVLNGAATQYVVSVLGTLQGSQQFDDDADYYAVALQAGQKYNLQVINLLDPTVALVSVGVFDSTNRLVATDILDPENAFQFTAERAGIYRFAVVYVGDPSYAGSADIFGAVPYQLTVTGVAEMGIGAIAANSFGASNIPGVSVFLQRADLGGLFAEDFIFSTTAQAAAGSIWAVDAAQIEDPSDQGFSSLVSAFASVDIGHVRARSGNAVDVAITAGRNVHTVEASNFLSTTLTAGGGLGVLRAGQMATPGDTGWTPSFIVVNSDNVGQDGIIDLIEVEGDLGSLETGGPAIMTNGGNVRHMRVGGAVYRDIFFGGGTPDETTFQTGQSVTFTDDSGALITISSPVERIGARQLPPVTLTVLTYGIRGSGGSVIMRVTTDRSVTISSNGAAGQFAEIGQIISTGEGTPVEINPATGLPQLGTATNPVNIIIQGNTRVDVFEVVGNAIDSIANRTGGEIVSVTATSVGSIGSLGTIGIARSTTGVAVEPMADQFGGLGYPFNDTRVGVNVSGDIVSVGAAQALGNIRAGGNIGTVVANTDGFDIPFIFEGITGIIHAGGNIGNVRIGEGVLGTGTGSVARTGIYAIGTINSVSGAFADIRGNIVSQASIGSISLVHGSLVNSWVVVPSEIAMSSPVFGEVITLPDTNPDTFGTPLYEIGSITVTGSGGILGSRFSAADIGPVTSLGFGIIGSAFQMPGSGVQGAVRAAGYGIRNSTFIGGGSLMSLTAIGNGTLIPATGYSSSVRFSEVVSVDNELLAAFDPFSGRSLSATNDLHGALGTSALIPVIAGVTDGGVIENVVAVGARELGSVTAYQIRNRADTNAPIIGFAYPMTLSFANRIGSIRTTSIIDGLLVTTGSIGRFQPGSDISRLGLVVSGTIGNTVIRGNILNNSFINAIGPNGNIQNLTVIGNLIGDSTISANGRINRIQIAGDMLGSVNVGGQTILPTSLGMFILGGRMYNSTLNVVGNVGTIQVAHNLGETGDSLTINGNLNRLVVGTNPTMHGASLATTLNVGGNVGQILVQGTIDADITIGGNLNSLQVIADPFSVGSSVINSTVAVGGNVNIARVNFGSVGGTIDAFGNINNFSIFSGSLLQNATVRSQIGNINSVLVRGGNLMGNVFATSGRIGRLIADGDIGDGATPLEITAGTLGVFQTARSIRSGATVTVNGRLDNLIVRGDVEAGATVIGTPILRRQINGNIGGVVQG